MMGDMNSLGWWGSGSGGVFMLLFWLLIVLGAAALIKANYEGRTGHAKKRRWEILRARYARGETGREEYELKRRDLES